MPKIKVVSDMIVRIITIEDISTEWDGLPNELLKDSKYERMAVNNAVEDIKEIVNNRNSQTKIDFEVFCSPYDEIRVESEFIRNEEETNE